MRTILEAKDISAFYVAGKSNIYAVNNVSLEIKEKEILGIVGESGCGKTTLVKIIYGFIEPPLKVIRGKVTFYISEEDYVDMLSPLSREKVWWKHISWIPQGAQNALNPMLRIRDIFIETLKKSLVNMDKNEMMKFIENHISKFSLPKDVLAAYPHQLSGGMKQRVTIALAMAFKPKLILADEPTSALDVVNQKIVLGILKEINSIHGSSIVIVSHDIDIIGTMCDRIAVMYAGDLLEMGETESLLKEPLHPYTKALIESLPRLGDKSRREGLKGQPPDLTSPPSGCKFHIRCPYTKTICKEKKPPYIEVKPTHSLTCWLYV
ncbi:MAG: ABC transporter ATP-binding protein [Candidatus Bathyarchaeia archaeon]